MSESTPLFEFEHVVKRYHGTTVALDDLTLRVQPGAIGLLGPNGSGKSTLIKLVLGLVTLTSGRATALGLNVQRHGRQIRQAIGYMPEDDCLIPGMTAVQSVSYVGELAGIPRLTALRRSHEVLDYVGLGEERHRDVATYSTGMKQKVKLAQALVHSPRIVFLDEPTSGLDPKGRDRMLHLIRDMWHMRHISVLVSTHILTDIEVCCESVVILGRGKLLKHDTLANLRRRPILEFQIRLESPALAARFATLLCEANLQLTGVEDDVCRLQVTTDECVPPSVFTLARDHRIVIREITTSRNTLEAIYLSAVQGPQAKTVHANP